MIKTAGWPTPKLNRCRVVEKSSKHRYSRIINKLLAYTAVFEDALFCFPHVRFGGKQSWSKKNNKAIWRIYLAVSKGIRKTKFTNFLRFTDIGKDKSPLSLTVHTVSECSAERASTYPEWMTKDWLGLHVN